MSDMVSEYTIEMQIRDDQTKDAIRGLEKGLKQLGDVAKNAVKADDISEGLKDAQKAAGEMIAELNRMAKDSSLNFDAIAKSYSKNSKQALAALERQYATLKDKLDMESKKYEENNRQIQMHKESLKDTNMDILKRHEILKELNKLENEQYYSQKGQLEAQVKQNREIRYQLKAAEQNARMERANVKYEKLRELKAKRKAATDKAEKKDLSDKIRQQKALIKSMEMAEKVQKSCVKQQNYMTRAIQQSEKAEARLMKVFKGVGKATQFVYNATGMIGGAARTAKAVAGAGRAAFGMVSGAIGSVSSAADTEVERERQANRVKGMSNADAQTLMQDIYVRTGADYAVIVDAINRVQGTLGRRGLDKNEIAQATEIELRYPGMSIALASTTRGTQRGIGDYEHAAAKLNAMQKATGASLDQIQASTQLFANRKDIAGGGSGSDYQAVYLAMQNSGAFETDEELEAVFKQFVRRQQASGKGVFEFAKDFRLEDYARGDRNKLQARTADQNMDWDAFARIIREGENTDRQRTEAENTAMKMRQIEIQKNQMLLKLIPAVQPVIEKLADLMTTHGDAIVNGFVGLFKTVLPMLEPIFNALGIFLRFMSETILPLLQKAMEAVMSFVSRWIDRDDEENSEAISKNANGGIVWGKSIVGERGPEAIIPLDYSRSQRAENIAYSIQNTFSMSGSQTTALALSEAVASRDFSRAMGRAAFKAARTGAF